MFLPVPPAQPSSEILKLEQFLDGLEKTYPPDNVTEENPLDIDHFDLLGRLIDCLNSEGNPDPGAVASMYELTRHYVNGLRQFCAGERDKLAMSNKMEKLSAALKEPSPSS